VWIDYLEAFDACFGGQRRAKGLNFWVISADSLPPKIT
jgi:hypothetical protein